MLRADLADQSAHDVLVLFSMIIGEAVDEGLIGSQPLPATPHQLQRTARTALRRDRRNRRSRRAHDNGLLTITAAYTGLRWGELTGPQWSRTYLDEDPCIHVDRGFGALHEIRGRLELGPPKSPASVRVVHLPPFLADELRAHRRRNPGSQFVFTGPDGGLHRRSNFRRRTWLPALAGDTKIGWSLLNEDLHFHDLRDTHETWLIEQRVPRVLRLVRLGHKRRDIDDLYFHVTPSMIHETLTDLQQRWAQDGGWTWQPHPTTGSEMT